MDNASSSSSVTGSVSGSASGSTFTSSLPQKCLECLETEEKQLLEYLLHTENVFKDVCSRKDSCLTRLGDLCQKISMLDVQSMFLERVERISWFARVFLVAEAQQIREKLDEMWIIHQNMFSECVALRVGMTTGARLPEFTLLHKASYEMSDWLEVFQFQIHDGLGMPLGHMELDLQGLYVAQLTRRALARSAYEWQQKEQQKQRQNSASATGATATQPPAPKAHDHAYAAYVKANANEAATAPASHPLVPVADISIPWNPYQIVIGEALSRFGSWQGKESAGNDVADLGLG